jgi:hypothetical protein
MKGLGREKVGAVGLERWNGSNRVGGWRRIGMGSSTNLSLFHPFPLPLTNLIPPSAAILPQKPFHTNRRTCSNISPCTSEMSSVTTNAVNYKCYTIQV